MKIKDVIIYSIFFLLCCFATAQIVHYQLTGQWLFEPTKTAEVKTDIVACSNNLAMARPTTTDPQLLAVAEYDQACQSEFFNQMMIFTDMPYSQDSAISMANAMAKRLNNFEVHNIKPIIVMEPDSNEGLVDFNEFAKGDYDEFIDTYFKTLKSSGVTRTQIGTWIPFPEPQQPFWNNNANPDDFAFSVNRYFKIVRNYFPEAKNAILLDSQVGSNEASQLVAYTRLIEAGIVDMVGLQGFPWHPTDEQDERAPVISASQFAPAYMLEELADSLDINEVLINTGTYRNRKLINGGEIAIQTQERQQTLDSIVDEVKLLKREGFTVTVNIFAEDKLAVAEGVNWAYWQVGNADDSSHTALFTSFIRDLKNIDTEISLFDSRTPAN